MPPCAQRVDPASSTSLDTSNTRSADCRARCSADGQPGDPGADDHDVGLDGPPGRRRPQPRGDHSVISGVVDQPGGPDARGDEQSGGAVLGDLREVGGAQFQVVDVEAVGSRRAPRSPP